MNPFAQQVSTKDAHFCEMCDMFSSFRTTDTLSILSPLKSFFVELSHQGQILKLIKKHTQPNPGNQHLTRSTFSSRTVASTHRGTRLEMQEIKSVSPTLISTHLQNQHQTRLAPHYLLGTVLKCLRLSYL